MRTTSVEPTDHLEMRKPGLLLVFSRPAELFRYLKDSGSRRPPLVMILFLLPFVPALTAIAGTGTLRAEFASDPTTAAFVGSAVFIAIAIGVAVMLLQVATLGVHLLFFGLFVRIAGTKTPAQTITKAWLYAVIPLVLRQLFLIAGSMVGDGTWISQRSSVIQFIDPFLVYCAVLLYLACRWTLEMTRPRALLVTFFSTFIGALGLLVEALL